MNFYNFIIIIIFGLTTEEIITKFRSHRLRVTTHRIAVYRAVLSCSHPDAERIVNKLRKEYPNITVATVYNNLEALEKARLIHKVLTEKGSMRYDGIIEEHHHLLDTRKDTITDYFDEDLTKLLNDYFRKKRVPGFKVSRIMVQLIGTANDKPSKTSSK